MVHPKFHISATDLVLSKEINLVLVYSNKFIIYCNLIFSLFFCRVAKDEVSASKLVDEDKKNVNLLRVYTIYKQKFRRLTKEEYEELLGPVKVGKVAAFKLCKEFMKAKSVPDDVNFERNIGFLSYPRFLPMVALLAERSEYKIKPGLVAKLNFTAVPERFIEKFSQLMVYGFWFLGRVITDSLSEKEQVNRGNLFNFVKGDLGFWWAGVKILDWNFYAKNEEEKHNCAHFIAMDSPKYRFHSDRAIFNMGQHPLYFLSDDDWTNFYQTVKFIKHAKVPYVCCKSSKSKSLHGPNGMLGSWCDLDSLDFEETSSSCSGSELSNFSCYENSIDSYGSRESVD